YDPNNQTQAITFQVPPALKGLPDATKANGICVVLDGFTAAVPIGAADVFSANFANGFVTRAVIREFVDELEKSQLGTKIHKKDLDFILTEDPPPIPAAFRDIASYQSAPPPAPQKTFEECLSVLLEQNSIQSTAM